MKKLARDLDLFCDMWLSNPEAKLAFAKLIERSLYGAAPEFQAVREWIAEEKAAAKSIGIR